MTETTVLAETNRRHVQAVVGSFSTAIFRSLPDGEPDFWCTGILLRFGDILVLVTAAHCLDTQKPSLFAKDGQLVHLSAQPIFGSRVLSLPDPLNDIATVRLSSEEAERIGEMQVPPLSASAPFEHRNAVSAPYLVVGFRACEQQMDHRGKVWRHEITSLLVGAARQSYYSITRLPHERILLFDARPATFRSKHGAGGVPKLHGMSGSPVWRYNPSESHSIQNVPPLVGMFIGQPSASSKVMMAARIGLIFEHVAAAYPDLAGYLPRFR